MSILIIACGFIVPRYQHARNLVLAYENKELSIIQSQGETVLIDPGILGRHISAPQKIRYTLIPYLITQGIRRIDFVVIPKPSLMVFKALTSFLEHFPIGTIYLPSWHATSLSNAGWSSWESLLKQAHYYGTTVQLVDQATTFLFNSSRINLIPEPKQTKRNKLIYHQLMVETQDQGLLNYAKRKESS
jgi:beta-lactamase superfamily II metal-dependent hydrolase